MLRQISATPGVGTSSSASGQFTLVSTATGNTITADAVVEEVHDDQMVITDHPIEQGATVSDHAYKMPARLDLIYAWSAGSPQNQLGGDADPMAFLKTIYQQFLGLQINRTLCTVLTGKRKYDNMLLHTVGITTDKDNENSMTVRARFQEILMATTQVLNFLNNGNMAIPQLTASAVNVGTVSLVPAPAINPSIPPVAP